MWVLSNSLFIKMTVNCSLNTKARYIRRASLGSPWLICQSTLMSADQIQYGGRFEHKTGKCSPNMSICLLFFM